MGRQMTKWGVKEACYMIFLEEFYPSIHKAVVAKKITVDDAAKMIALADDCRKKNKPLPSSIQVAGRGGSLRAMLRNFEK